MELAAREETDGGSQSEVIEKGHPIFLGGSTGVGKSAIALKLAEKIGGEIVSVDSMQVYRGMDIGTAKPSPEEQAKVQHHLIDVVEVSEEFDGAQFARLAIEAARATVKRGNVPIFCGGTGLYFQIYLEGLGNAPARDPVLRSELEALSLEQLAKELNAKDPQMAAKIDLNNRRRLVRAIEVIRITGKPFSEQRASWNARGPQTGEYRPRRLFITLKRSKEELDQRIEKRVDTMFKRGLVEETENLMRKGLESNPSAMQAIGYRQVVEYLQGKSSFQETVQRVKQRTKAYAKRQRIWFQKQLDSVEMDSSETEHPDELVDEIALRYRRFVETKPLPGAEKAIH